MGGFSYPETFSLSSGLAAGAVGFLEILMVAFLLALMLIMSVAAVCYVLQSLGLQSIAKRREIRNGWLVWLPVAGAWIIGSISDQYQYVVKGRITNRRKTLLILNIIVCVVSSLYDVATTMYNILEDGIDDPFAQLQHLSWLGLVFAGLAVAMAVVEYMCLFDLYRSCKPKKQVVFLVLSIVFPVTIPFFIFSCRNADLGMPPRKQPAPSQIVEMVQQTPVEADILQQPEEFPVVVTEEPAEAVQDPQPEEE